MGGWEKFVLSVFVVLHPCAWGREYRILSIVLRSLLVFTMNALRPVLLDLWGWWVDKKNLSQVSCLFSDLCSLQHECTSTIGISSRFLLVCWYDESPQVGSPWTLWVVGKWKKLSFALQCRYCCRQGYIVHNAEVPSYLFVWWMSPCRLSLNYVDCGKMTKICRNCVRCLLSDLSTLKYGDTVAAKTAWYCA